MKVVFTLLLTALLITGIGGCNTCGDGYYLDINQMQFYAIRINRFGNLEGIKESQPIPFDSVFFQADFTGELYGLNNQISFDFLPAAVASDDCPGLLGTKEAIDKITVITLTDFNTDFKANDTINRLIEANVFMERGYGSFKNLDKFIVEEYPGIRDLWGSKGAFYMKLQEKPTQPVIKLRVDVAFTNGEKYSGETLPITIKQ